MHFQNIAAALSPLAFGLVNAQSEDTPPGYANSRVTLLKDGNVTAQNFPDVDIELLSPYFLNTGIAPAGWKNGSASATPQFEQDHFLQKLAARNDWMSYQSPDFLSEEGRQFPSVFLTSTKTPDPSKNSTKLRVLIQGHIHGNEPAGEEAILAFLGKMDDNSTWAESVLENLDIMILPRVNPDGVAYFQRFMATGYDPNRDFSVMARQQTRDLIALYSKFEPHIFLDCHEYTANRRFGEEGNLVNPADTEVSPVSGLNVHEDIFDLNWNLFTQNMYAALERNDLRTSTYFTAAANSTQLTEASPHAQYALTHNSLRQAIAILTESRGIGLGNQHFQRRVAANFICIEELINTAVDNAERIYNTIEDARKEWIDSDEDIAITPQGREENITWTWMDANNGSLIDVPVTYQNYTPTGVNLTRSRPEAYVFSRAWGDIAERLRISGVDIVSLESPFQGEVQAFKIETSSLAPARFEGITHNTVSTSNFTREVTIPAGGYWISTRQVNAAIAMSFLEPEDVASAVTYNLIPVDEGDEYPVYRVMKND
ncbi:carboxypeptidase [Sarocladium strictum]